MTLVHAQLLGVSQNKKRNLSCSKKIYMLENIEGSPTNLASNFNFSFLRPHFFYWSKMWLKRDGYSTRFAFYLREFLTEAFCDLWIGRGLAEFRDVWIGRGLPAFCDMWIGRGLPAFCNVWIGRDLSVFSLAWPPHKARPVCI